jgi:hypothetical protein
MFWKKKKADTRQDSKIILGMVMLNDKNSFDVDSFLNDFKNSYDHTLTIGRLLWRTQKIIKAI